MLGLAVAGGTAFLILLVGLALWIWNKPAPEPIPAAGLDEILISPPSAEWRWRRLRENTAVLVLEFPNLAVQGSTMNRIAAFLEKRSGARDRLLGDAELAALIKASGDNASTFYLGHDYSLDRLGQFFSLASAQKLQLNAQEQKLLDQLLKWEILKAEVDGSYHSTAERALVSFTATQLDDPATPEDESVDTVRRESVLRHELSHGEFFTNSDYRQQCWDFWRTSLTEAQRQMFRNYLASIDYDPKNEELMVNETQAVLMHTPDTRAFNAGDLGLNELELERLRVRFRQAH